MDHACVNYEGHWSLDNLTSKMDGKLTASIIDGKLTSLEQEFGLHSFLFYKNSLPSRIGKNIRNENKSNCIQDRQITKYEIRNM